MAGGAGEFLQAPRTTSVTSSSRVRSRTAARTWVEPVRGGAVPDQPGLLQPGQGQVKKPVRPAVHQQPVAEIA